MAHYIYVLDEGKIVEHGTHEELMINDHIYADLFAKQAQHYKMQE